VVLLFDQTGGMLGVSSRGRRPSRQSASGDNELPATPRPEHAGVPGKFKPIHLNGE